MTLVFNAGSLVQQDMRHLQVMVHTKGQEKRYPPIGILVLAPRSNKSLTISDDLFVEDPVNDALAVRGAKHGGTTEVHTATRIRTHGGLSNHQLLTP
jgi:hypothetical protein